MADDYRQETLRGVPDGTAPGRPSGGGGNQPAPHTSLLTSPIASFAPWIIFWVVANPSTWEVACVSALIVAVVLLALQLDTGSVAQRFVDLGVGDDPAQRTPIKLKAPKILDVGTVLFFAVFSILGAFISRAGLIQLEHYAQVISSGALALIVLVSLVIGRPFTEAYARENTPQEVWHLPAFHRTNVVMSTVWFFVFVISAVLGLLAQTSWGSSHSLQNWFNWYIPIALIVLGFKFNQWYPAQVRARTTQRAAQGTA